MQNLENYAKICEKWENMQKVGNYAILYENIEIMRFSHNSHNRIIHGPYSLGSPKWCRHFAKAFIDFSYRYPVPVSELPITNFLIYRYQYRFPKWILQKKNNKIPLTRISTGIGPAHHQKYRYRLATRFWRQICKIPAAGIGTDIEAVHLFCNFTGIDIDFQCIRAKNIKKQ